MKIKIYECTRTLLYAPIYYLYLKDYFSWKENGSERRIELEFRKRPLGDKGVIKKLLEHKEPTKIPIGICDPTAIFVYNDSNKTHTTDENITDALRNLSIIGNIIDKVAIWLLALTHENNKNSFSQHIENKAFDEEISLADLHDLADNKIYLSKYGITTNRIFNKYFINEKNPYQSRPLKVDWEDELIKLFDKKFVLSNTPWLIDGLIKKGKLEKVTELITDNEINNPRLFNVKSFDSERVAFTSIFTRETYFQSVSSDTDLNTRITNRPAAKVLFETFLSDLTDIIHELYKDPEKFSNELNTMMNKYNFYCGFEDSKEMGHILSENLIRLINKGIYQYYPIADLNSLINAINLDDALVDRTRKFHTQIRNLFYNEFIRSKIGEILTV